MREALFQVANGVAQQSIIDTVGIRVMSDFYGEPWLSPYNGSNINSYLATIPTQSITRLLGIGVGSTLSRVTSLQPWVKRDCYSYDYTLERISDKQELFLSFGDSNPKLNRLLTLADMNISTGTGLTSSGLHFAAIADSITTMAWLTVDDYEIGQYLLDVSVVAYTTMDYGVVNCINDAFWYETPVRKSGTTVTDLAAMSTLPQNSTKIRIAADWAKSLAHLYMDVNVGSGLSGPGLDAAKVMALGIADASDLRNYLPLLDGGNEVNDPWVFYPGHIAAWRRRFASDLTRTQYDAVAQYIEEEDLGRHYDAVWVYAYDNWTDVSALGQYSVRRYASGYGYDSSTVPVRLSLSVLAAYAVAVAAYAIYTMTTGRTATSWDSIGEVILLALKSRQPENMDKCSIGVETMATYRKVVKIRINEDSQEAEMILADDPGLKATNAPIYKSIEANVRY